MLRACRSGCRASDRTRYHAPVHLPDAFDDEKNLNLNGEFLGVTSMAVFSAPWFLQTPLIVLVGLLFMVKVAQSSRYFRQAMDELANADEEQEYEQAMLAFNRIFFGFTVARHHLPVYWIGTAIYLVTAAFSVYQLLARLMELGS